MKGTRRRGEVAEKRCAEGGRLHDKCARVGWLMARALCEGLEDGRVACIEEGASEAVDGEGTVQRARE